MDRIYYGKDTNNQIKITRRGIGPRLWVVRLFFYKISHRDGKYSKYEQKKKIFRDMNFENRDSFVCTIVPIVIPEI